MKKKKETLSKIDQLFIAAQKKLATSNPSVKKMREFLKKKGGNKKEIDEIVLKLKKYQLLDEDEIIKNVISYCDAKHYGYNKLINMLKQREIDSSKIAKVLKDETRELRESKELLKRLKKRYKNKSTVNLKQSVYSALIRYGFDENIASIRVEEVYNLPQEELNVLKLDFRKATRKYSSKFKGKALKDKVTNNLLSKGYKLNDIRKAETNIYEMD